MGVLIQEIILQLREIQQAKIWIGENFSKKLHMVSETEVFTRPLPSLHSVAEIIAHLTTWRKETILKIKTGKGSLSDDSEENWLPNEKLMDVGWSEILNHYSDTLAELIALLEQKEDRFLEETYYDNDFQGIYTYRFILNGMVHHDLYHLGQLGIIIKLLKLNRAP